MTVAFDAVGPSPSGFYSGSGLTTTAQWQHVCTGSNLLLLVDVGISNNPDTGLTVNASYAGQSMTLLAGPIHSNGTNKGFIVRFLLINPAAGRNTVTVNVTGGSACIVGGSMSFNGADQSTGVGTTYSATGQSATPTVSVTSNTSGNIIASSNVSGHSYRGTGSGGTKTYSVNGNLTYYASNAAGATWAATGSPVTTSFSIAVSPGLAGDEWAIISHEILSGTTGAVQLTTPNIQLTAGSFGNQANVTQWWGFYARQPNTFFAGAPPLLPIQIAVDNTEGDWLFALMSWRQDGGQPGQLIFPSTVNVSDDAGNFWIPVEAGLPNTGIVRTSIWMAPAARAVSTVTFSPASVQASDAFQSAFFGMVFQIQGDSPWYTVQETDFGYVNQGTSLTVSQETSSTSVFTVGILASDNPYNMPVNVTSGLGWANLTTFPISNGVDSSGDLQQWGFIASTAGTPLSLSIARSSGGSVADLSGTIITIHGVDDTLPFPYATPLKNWPVLVTEIASGPVINANPLMVTGTTDWTLLPAGTAGSITAVTWPTFQPYPNYQALIPDPPSIAITPSGNDATAQLVSEPELINVALNYSTNAWAYCPGNNGQGITLTAQIVWYDHTGSTILETSSGIPVSPGQGEWENLTFFTGISPPGGAVYAAAAILVTPTQSLLVPSTAVVYVGYCGVGSSDAYENVSQDQTSWSDVSNRNFTQDAISISRGIQYEQQSLEAGQMTVTLVNSDGAMMFGNLLSTYWPNIGDTDVPIRLRAIWPQSITPYSVLFSGFTDQITFGWDEGTWFGYAEVQASDAWSRLTSQMLEPYIQEILEDNPQVLITTSNSPANSALSNVSPASETVSNFGAGSAVATFGGNSLALPGASSLSNWQVTGVGTATASSANQGIALTYFPPGNSPLPPVAGGVTATFWMAAGNVGAGGTLSAATNPASDLIVCTAWSGGGPTWSIFIDNTGSLINTTTHLTVYDQATGAGTTTSLGGPAQLLFGTATTVQTYFAVTFTQTSLTVYQATVGGGGAVINTVPANLAPTLLGFSFGGNAGPLYATAGTVSTVGFWNSAFADIAVFEGLLPPARLAAEYVTSQAISQSGLSEAQGEVDTSRLARILGYAGATPVTLQEEGWFSLPSPPSADEDMMTAITDTNGQVTNSYFTNIAASTLAFMFVNGPGVLVYRRRLQQYDREIGQWALGDNPALPLNGNTLGTSASVAGWFTLHGATLTAGSAPSVSPLFLYAGLMHGDGSTATPQIKEGAVFGTPITAGDYYTVSCMAYSPQGWATGVTIGFTYNNSIGGGIVTYSSVTTPLAAGSITYLTCGPFRAPQNADFALIVFVAQGTPASTVQFYVTNVQLTQVPVVNAGGAGAVTPEVPYLIGTTLSSDRALLYNQVILNQYGTNTNTTFNASSIVFQPTSGVIVTIQNNPSVISRAGVPYTATLYLNNTAQLAPYYLFDPSMEDFGNWITQTLAAPLLRPDSVTITPAATPQAMIMALQAEIADTATYRRRPIGAPEIQVLTYISKLEHSIDIASGQWTTQYELSPYQAGVVLACDDVIHGPPTGGNLLGW